MEVSCLRDRSSGQALDRSLQAHAEIVRSRPERRDAVRARLAASREPCCPPHVAWEPESQASSSWELLGDSVKYRAPSKEPLKVDMR